MSRFDSSVTPEFLRGLSDAQLDDMYIQNYAAGNVGTYSAIEREIIERLSSVGSFVKGFFGSTRFPLYNGAGNFKQTVAAQESVADNAANVAGAIGGFSFKVLAPVITLGVIGLVIYFFVLKKR